MSAAKRVLFICTGNYYRSRFAEAVFNHLAEERGLNWRAFSRGMMIHLAPGPISEHTREALEERGIHLKHTAPDRVQIAEVDFAGADLIVALRDAEHRPMIVQAFPHWEEKTVFWEVPDLPDWGPQRAMPAIEAKVTELVDSLKAAEPAAPA